FASVISTLLITVRKKCQLRYISCRSGSSPASRAALRPEPAPNQPGTIWRDWVQPNTHGIARSPSSPLEDVVRLEGREPMFRSPSCSTGVAETKYSGRFSSSTRVRYRAKDASETD